MKSKTEKLERLNDTIHACLGVLTTRLTLRLTIFPLISLVTLLVELSGFDLVLVLRETLRRDGLDLDFTSASGAVPESASS